MRKGLLIFSLFAAVLCGNISYAQVSESAEWATKIKNEGLNKLKDFFHNKLLFLIFWLFNLCRDNIKSSDGPQEVFWEIYSKRAQFTVEVHDG